MPADRGKEGATGRSLTRTAAVQKGTHPVRPRIVLSDRRSVGSLECMNIGDFIVKTPGTCGGRVRVQGRRIPVSSIYRWFRSGLAPEDILSKYEALSLAEAYAAIAYAVANNDEISAEIAREDELAEQEESIRGLLRWRVFNDEARSI